MPFSFEKLDIEGLTVITPKVFGDERGFFMETYQEDDFKANGLNDTFIQDNHSMSMRGVLRGLHYQIEPNAQAKLVRVTRGAVWDVAVDIRKDSPTFGKWYGLVLSEENKKMLYIPSGFAHGFLTLEDNTHFVYKCSNNYAPQSEGGIVWNDTELNINWPIEDTMDIIVSAKDQELPPLTEANL